MFTTIFDDCLDSQPSQHYGMGVLMQGELSLLLCPPERPCCKCCQFWISIQFLCLYAHHLITMSNQNYYMYRYIHIYNVTLSGIVCLHAVSYAFILHIVIDLCRILSAQSCMYIYDKNRFGGQFEDNNFLDINLPINKYQK